MPGVVSKVVLAAALTSLVVAGKPTAAFAAEHDGQWTVRVITEQGGCDRTASYDVKVTDGQIIYSSYTSVSLSGKISPQGEVVVSLRHHDDTASGSGRLTERTGAGGWRGTGKFSTCSGRWEARRR
jgi:hypothetical protein